VTGTARPLVAIALALIALCLAVGGAFLLGIGPVPPERAEWGFIGFQGVAAAVYAVVGALIAVRHPRNPIGWLLLLGGGLFNALQFLTHHYAVHAAVTGSPDTTLVELAFWFEEWIWIPIVGSVGILTMLLFPTGRLASPRWRLPARVGLVGIVAATIGWGLVPFWAEEASATPGAPVMQAILVIGTGLFAASLIAAVTSMILRFRAATGVERQQLKWVAFAGGLAVLVAGLYAGVVALTGDDQAGSAALALAFLGIPSAIGIAILRHRLLDIDLLINRALVYATLSVVLGAVYVGAVLVLQEVLRPITAGGGTLAIAASTLAVAAMFQPVRRRVHGAVDRRFYRSRYDAQRTLEAFATRLRDEVDLDSLTDALRAATHSTVRPTTASIWLRDRAS
jgi:hypothetical protein